MKNTRRMKRMTRAQRNKAGALNLTSLMDVFTILVLYLLVNQSTVEITEPARDVKLPDSVAEAKPRQTIVLMVSEQLVSIEGEPLATITEVEENKTGVIEPLKEKLLKIKESVIGVDAEAVEKSSEVTIMAHRKVPFKVLKTLMSSCTSAGYTKISLAVNQKASQQ